MGSLLGPDPSIPRYLHTLLINALKLISYENLPQTLRCPQNLSRLVLTNPTTNHPTQVPASGPLQP
jgi:hypothetical protein